MRFQFYCALAVISICSTSFDTNQERFTFFKIKDKFLVLEKDSITLSLSTASQVCLRVLRIYSFPHPLLCARMIHDPSIHWIFLLILTMEEAKTEFLVSFRYFYYYFY